MATNRAEKTNVKSTNADHQELDQKLVIPVIEEAVTVEKRVIESGKVRVSKRISEHEELVDVPLFHEEVSVERVPINLFVETPPPAVRQEGDTMVIPVVEEQIILQKKLLLVEELRVTKQTVEAHRPQKVSILKEEVDVKRFAGDEKKSHA